MSDLALVEEATKKSGVVWLALPGLPQPRAAWHVWHDGSVYLVTGGEGEQPLPGLPEARTIVVTVPSKDKGGRLVSWVADVTEVRPDTEEWDTVAPLLAKARLNAVDHPGQIERWSRDSYLMRLTPGGEASERPGAYPQDYAAVRPVPTPATTAPPSPFMIGGRRRRVDQ